MRNRKAPRNNAAPAESSPEERVPIVGVGASAGGYDAFRQLLKGLPPDPGLSFVFIQHLDPEHESMLTRLLAKATNLPVTEVKEGMQVERNHVYVIPPNTIMEVAHGVLHLAARKESAARNLPVDQFLKSLAEDEGSRAIGVILSGTASDGTLGLKAIKAEGGITFAQDEKSAAHDGMPRSAIASGCVDFVLSPEDIARELARIGRHPYLAVHPRIKVSDRAADANDDLRKIFRMLRTATGVDFTYYKYNTIMRRINRRMLVQKIEELPKYISLLEHDRHELEALYEDILIHVTAFFREPEAFQEMKESFFPKILGKKPQGEPVRVWVPGCSTGEEAYSLAILLLEYMGDRTNARPIQIFGTDISEPAIEKARAGVYTESNLADVSAERLRRFFVRAEGGYQIQKSVREMCIFARQDLAKDPPFSRLDLVSCRNVLIYMGPVLQKKILTIFHYALRTTGMLVLGKAENISGFSDYFTPAGPKGKIYFKKPGVAHPVFDFPGVYEALAEPRGPKGEPPPRFDVQKEADQLVLSHYAPPGLLVNENLQILQFRGQSSPFLAPSHGEASLNLLKMVRPEFTVEMRTAIQRAKKQNAPVRKEDIELQRDGRIWNTSLEVAPIRSDSGERYYLILFNQKPAPQTTSSAPAAKGKVSRAQTAETGRLRRELQSTKEYLQSIIQEQEATNEELKSANEEILSSNEELQSTNEELETAKEELESTNEELVTVNEQLQNRNVELAQTTDDLTNLLSAVNLAFVVLGRDLRIRRFTPQAERLLNILPSDIGRPIDKIRPNIDVPDLHELIVEVMDVVVLKEVEVQDREGRWYLLRVRPYRTVDSKIDGVVIIFIDIDALKSTQAAVRQQSAFSAAIMESAGSLVVVTDLSGKIVRFNEACQQTSGYSLAQVRGKTFWEALWPREQARAAKEAHQRVAGGARRLALEGYWVTRQGGHITIAWVAATLADAQGAAQYVIWVGADVTERRRMKHALETSEASRQRTETQLQTLAGGLLVAQEEERRRISRELHDHIGSELAALSFRIEALQGELKDKTAPGFSAAMDVVKKGLSDLLETVRQTAHEMHPSAVETVGLAGALRAYCAEISRQDNVKVRFTQKGNVGSLPAGVGMCCYRVVQAALRNVVEHSGTDRAQVSLAETDGVLRLRCGMEGTASIRP